ncbi:MAG: hypothetical protein ACRDTM_10285 [Micromonosporaceae bacterium]
MGRHDAAAFWYEVGRQFQAVSLVMDRHQIVDAQQICACGRIAVRVLPMFGLRCEVAFETWNRAYTSMCQVSRQLSAERAVGMATVPGR